MKNFSAAIFLITEQVRGILVTYEPDPSEQTKSNRYLYKTFDNTIAIDDYVVVPTDTRHGMTVCRVVDVDVDPDFDSNITYKWIIGSINTADVEEIKKQESEAIEKVKKAQTGRYRRQLMDDLVKDTDLDVTRLPLYSSSKDKESDIVLTPPTKSQPTDATTK